MATSLAVPPIQHYPAIYLADAICQLSTVLFLQSAERPIGIRNHVDATPRRTQQNGVLRGSLASRSAFFRCVENFPRIFDELAHAALSFRLGQIRGTV
jgi:hypothetical protein